MLCDTDSGLNTAPVDQDKEVIQHCGDSSPCIGGYRVPYQGVISAKSIIATHTHTRGVPTTNIAD